MSAYGALPPRAQLEPALVSTLWKLQPKKPERVQDKEHRDWTHVSVHHLTLSSAPAELVESLYDEFSSELSRDQARTYPQEAGMTRHEFESYFFARDVFVGIGVKKDIQDSSENVDMVIESLPNTKDDIKSALGDREWRTALAGFYYVKPNYPGHSSHICNGGFVIPFSARGLGLGNVMGRSFLHYAPRLGYRGSVFNLVYADNPASLKIWDSLGFQRIGLVPGAGKRVRTIGEGDSKTEEEYYVDAHIIFKSFV